MGNDVLNYPSAATRGMPSVVYNEIPMAEIANNPAKGIAKFDDFCGGLTATDSYSDAVTTAIGAGTLVDGGEQFGALVLTPGTTENQGIEMQWRESVLADAGYTAVFGARVKLSDATQTDAVIGLCITDATATGGTSDEITFRTADGSANITYQTTKDSTGSAVDSGVDFVDGTYVNLEMRLRGEAAVDFYVDNTLVGTGTTNIPNDEVLAPTLGVLTGEAAANTLTVDYMYFAQWTA